MQYIKYSNPQYTLYIPLYTPVILKQDPQTRSIHPHPNSHETNPSSSRQLS